MLKRAFLSLVTLVVAGAAITGCGGTVEAGSGSPTSSVEDSVPATDSKSLPGSGEVWFENNGSVGYACVGPDMVYVHGSEQMRVVPDHPSCSS